MPFRQKPIRRQVPMEGTACRPIDVDIIVPADHAQRLNIKICIAYFQRIKRPFHSGNSAVKGVLALSQFKTPSNPEISIFRQDPHHMRMKIDSSFPVARYSRQKTQQIIFAVDRPKTCPPILPLTTRERKGRSSRSENPQTFRWISRHSCNRLMSERGSIR